MIHRRFQLIVPALGVLPALFGLLAADPAAGRERLPEALLASVRGADGATYNNGSPNGCSENSAVSPQVGTTGCNASNSGDTGPPVPCISCGNDGSTTNQPVTKNKPTQPPYITVNSTQSLCGQKRIGYCTSHSTLQPVLSHPATGVIPEDGVPPIATYLCDDFDGTGQGDCGPATQTTPQ